MKQKIKYTIFTIITIIPFVIIALYGFLSHDYKLHTNEAKSTLRDIYELQKKYFDDNGFYSLSFDDFSWTDKHLRYYCYYLNNGAFFYKDVLHTQSINHYIDTYGPIINKKLAESYIEKYKCLAIAIGNLDEDPSFDIWCIDYEGKIIQLNSDFWK